MSAHTWWLFLAMSFVISGTPGPNMLLVMSQGARHGMGGAIATMAGCMTSLIAMMALSAAGMGALLQAFPSVFEAMRLLGAAYLAWLGIQSILSKEEASDAPPPERAPGHHYRQGVYVAASNPKAILFAAAFFPQFLNADAPTLPQFAILLGTFSVVEISWYFVYAASGYKLAAYLKKASVMRAFNRITGGIFVAFAAAMALVRE
ncbi:LysE family translocator [Massilia sp. TS11]|uniref:LysE family translocator n=1 Tax=Massilia sp. TS11 TaxID=2908003 RepID=UPI001EDB0F32|nr:LysE family translocator [Massilia sp. TS11]MCG2583829.1 LysE family translocator [Massilia sp. TS11]